MPDPQTAHTPCRSGCAWYMGWPHDKDCKGTRGTPLMPPGPEPIRIEDTANPKFGSELREKTEERLKQLERTMTRCF